MPYIKKDLRPPFDEAVEAVKNDEIGRAIGTVASNLEGKDIFAVDGCLNYFLTQILRKVDDLERCENVMVLTLINAFLLNPRYFLLERLLGLISAMQIEFKRRGWRSEALNVLERVYFYIERRYIDYEDEVILKNGDLE